MASGEIILAKLHIPRREEILQMTESPAIKVGQISIRYLLDGVRTGTTRTFDQQP